MQRTKATVSEPAIYLAMLLALCPSGGCWSVSACKRYENLRIISSLKECMKNMVEYSVLRFSCFYFRT
jgi:hypothetical protein